MGINKFLSHGWDTLRNTIAGCTREQWCHWTFLSMAKAQRFLPGCTVRRTRARKNEHFQAIKIKNRMIKNAVKLNLWKLSKKKKKIVQITVRFTHHKLLRIKSRKMTQFYWTTFHLKWRELFEQWITLQTLPMIRCFWSIPSSDTKSHNDSELTCL